MGRIILDIHAGKEGAFTDVKSLLRYKEIVICAGVPGELAPRVVEFMHRLRYSGFGGKILLYMDTFGATWPYLTMVRDSDGVIYYTGKSMSKNGIRSLRSICDYVRTLDDKAGRDDRLYADTALESGNIPSIVKSAGRHWKSAGFLDGFALSGPRKDIFLV